MQVVRHEAVHKICEVPLGDSTQKVRFDKANLIGVREVRRAVVRAKGEEISVLTRVIESSDVLGIGMHGGGWTHDVRQPSA
jgi:hypothetical protein